MTNFEYWKDEIEKIINDENGVAIFNEKPVKCRGFICNNCDLMKRQSYGCTPRLLKWLYAEHIERPKLTANERKLCEVLNGGWIARDADNTLAWYLEEPKKNGEFWDVYNNYIGLNKAFTDCNFSFIKWEDKQPWSVEELLKLEVEE